jgi:hypothetical protein
MAKDVPDVAWGVHACGSGASSWHSQGHFEDIGYLYFYSYAHVLRHIFLILSQPILCSCSLMLRAQERGSKYQFYSHWCDPTGLESTFYRTRSEEANHYTTDVVEEKLSLKLNRVKY